MKKSLLVFVLSLLIMNPGFTQEEGTGDEQIEYPEKRHGLDTWEYIVNIPGYVLTAPFWAIDAALIPVSYAITETKIIPKTVDLLTSDDGMRGVFPTYESRTGAGLSFYQKGLLQQNTELQLIATVWARARQSYQVNFNRIHLGGPFESSVNFHYYNYADEPFFGLGNQSSRDMKTNYAHEQSLVNVSIALNAGQYNSINVVAGYEKNQIFEGRDDNYPSTVSYYQTILEPRPPGLRTPVNFVRGEIQFMHNSKDAPGNPTRGWEFQAKGALYKQSDGSRYGFYRGTVDLAKYIHLFYNRVLVLRTAGQITTSYNDGVIPFYYLSELGERETIRGYARGRYRDKDKVLGSVEYRFPILKRYRSDRESGSIDMLLFVDAGKVSPDITDDFTDGMHTSYGFGFRLYNSKSLMMQFLTGFSDDGARVYFVLN